MPVAVIPFQNYPKTGLRIVSENTRDGRITKRIAGPVQSMRWNVVNGAFVLQMAKEAVVFEDGKFLRLGPVLTNLYITAGFDSENRNWSLFNLWVLIPWKHIRTTNPIESTFATVRHRTKRAKGCLSRDKSRIMVFKLVQAAEKNWLRLNGRKELRKLISGIKFTDGKQAVQKNVDNTQNAA